MLVSVCRFSLPEQKIGALFNEKFKKASYTVENTHAHNLRLEIAAKLLEKFGSVERAFEYYTAGAASRAERSPHRFTASLQTVDVCTDTDYRCICIFVCLMHWHGMGRTEAP
jgi:hypothetical protein